MVKGKSERATGAGQAPGMSSGESGRPALLYDKEVLCAAPGALRTRKQANAAEAGPVVVGHTLTPGLALSLTHTAGLLRRKEKQAILWQHRAKMAEVMHSVTGQDD